VWPFTKAWRARDSQGNAGLAQCHRGRRALRPHWRVAPCRPQRSCEAAGVGQSLNRASGGWRQRPSCNEQAATSRGAEILANVVPTESAGPWVSGSCSCLFPRRPPGRCGASSRGAVSRRPGCRQATALPISATFTEFLSGGKRQRCDNHNRQPDTLG